MRVYPTPVGDAAPPTVSSLNLSAGTTVANLVTVKVGAGGAVSLYNDVGSTHVLADVGPETARVTTLGAVQRGQEVNLERPLRVDGVVALVGGESATVKKFYREREGRIRLQPANATMQPMYFAPEEVQIQGIVIAVIRKY